MTSTTSTGGPMPRYRGLCGAIVRVFPHTYREPYSATTKTGHAWRCDCGELGGGDPAGHGEVWPTTERKAREGTNAHASRCRALPATSTTP